MGFEMYSSTHSCRDLSLCYCPLHRANCNSKNVLSAYRNLSIGLQTKRGKKLDTTSAAQQDSWASTGSSDNSGGGRGGGSGIKATRCFSGGWQPGKGQPQLHWLQILGLAAVSYVVVGLTQPWSLLRRTNPTDTSQQTVAVIIPVLNESSGILDILQELHELTPPVHEIIVVDGGSTDNTLHLVRRSGLCTKVLTASRGRASQMNAGAAAAQSDLLCFLHADTQPPQDLVYIMRRELSDRHVVLAGFSPSIEVPGRKLHLMSFHNLIKTYYAPLIFRPLAFLRGLRALFGDQAMFCRKADFLSVGGFDPQLSIMEDADLCIRMHEAGPTTAAQQQMWQGSSTAPVQGTHRQTLKASDSPPRRLAKSGTALHHQLCHDPQQQQQLGDQQLYQVLRNMQAWWHRCLQPRGRIKQVLDRKCVTSGRRIAAWGSLRATYIHVVIGLNWYLGRNPQQLRELYDRMYTDSFR